jgi:alpha-1,4-digalacturonate transport system permease protein
LDLENYVSSLAAGNFPVYLLIYGLRCVVSTVLLLINLIAVYALAKYIFTAGHHLHGDDATLLIRMQVIKNPIILQLKTLRMLNSRGESSFHRQLHLHGYSLPVSIGDTA